MLCCNHDYYLDDVNDESEIGEGVKHIAIINTQRSFEVRDKYRDYFLSCNCAVP